MCIRSDRGRAAAHLHEPEQRATRVAICMSTTFIITAIVVLVLLLGGALWRSSSRRQAIPCPSWLVPLLENPYMEWQAGSRLLLDRACVEPGMWVLDIGAGPGRLSLPAAERVGPEGRVVALDLQPGMIRRLQQRIDERGVTNVEPVLGGAGDGKVQRGVFDRAFLVTVLGEIVDQASALREIHEALKPGGILSITEVLPDPHYQTRATVRRLAQAAGFRPGESFATWLAFTLNCTKDGGA